MIDPSPWSGLRLVEPAAGGHRNEVWYGLLDGTAVAVRRSKRSAASLAWELDLIGHLDTLGFRVPAIVAADDGRRSVAGVVVQQWLDGREPSTDSDWDLVAQELGRLHTATTAYRQRPDCSTVCELPSTGRSVDADLSQMPPEVAARVVAVFDQFDDVPTAVIHGDPMAGNIRIDGDVVGLLDWDESRVDLTWHDLSNLGIQVLDDANHRRAQRLSNAWEAANGWTAEPDYAQRRLDMLTP